MSDTAGKIKAILMGQLELRDENVTGTSRIVEDLGADSLDVVELVAILEEEFGINIPEEDEAGTATAVSYTHLRAHET